MLKKVISIEGKIEPFGLRINITLGFKENFRYKNLGNKFLSADADVKGLFI